MSKSVLILLHQWDHLVAWEGVLYRRVFHPDGAEECFQLLLPIGLQKELLTQLHQEHGHQGIEQTMELVRKRCYWPGMASDVACWCLECERCQVVKDNQPLACSFMGHLSASRPHEMFAIDFTVLEPSWSGFENVVVMMDIFSKYTMASPTRDQ